MHSEQFTFLDYSFDKFIQTLSLSEYSMTKSCKNPFIMKDEKKVYLYTATHKLDSKILDLDSNVEYTVNGVYNFEDKSLNNIGYTLKFKNMEDPLFSFLINKFGYSYFNELIEHSKGFIKNTIKDNYKLEYDIKILEDGTLSQVEIFIVYIESTIMSTKSNHKLTIYDKHLVECYNLKDFEDYMAMAEIVLLCQLHNDFISLITNDKYDEVINIYKANKSECVQLVEMYNFGS